MDIKIRNLKKEYTNHQNTKKEVLHGISLDIPSGEFVSIMGASGSGKSTFLKILGGIERISGGSVCFGDKKMEEYRRTDLDKHKRDTVGIIFQDFNLIEGLTLRENIVFPQVLAGDKVDSKRLDELMKYVDIDKVCDNYPDEVSGGQQQRACICRALLKSSEVILADEPTGNLDSNSTKDILDLLEDIHNNRKTSIVMVTHDPYAASYSDRVVLIKDGVNYREIKKSGTRKEYMSNVSEALSELRNVR